MEDSAKLMQQAWERGKVDRARSKLQTMTNTALRNMARRYEMDLMQGGREVSKEHKIARMMMCEAIVEELGATQGEQ